MSVAIEVKEQPAPVQKSRAPLGLMEKYALIKMHPKRDENEVTDVPACVNGHNILLQRGKWCPVNWSFVECLRNAAHPRFSTESGSQRVAIGTTERFPFQGPYEISYDNYLKFKDMLKSGVDITERDISTMVGVSV